MGLDMYAFSSLSVTSSPTPDDLPTDSVRFFHWRKHSDPHGWMKDLFYSKGGTGDFNCQPLALTGEDLDRLEADIVKGGLPHTSGFFFGQSDGSERPDDLEFVRLARLAMADDRTVYYDSWW